MRRFGLARLLTRAGVRFFREHSARYCCLKVRRTLSCTICIDSKLRLWAKEKSVRKRVFRTSVADTHPTNTHPHSEDTED